MNKFVEEDFRPERIAFLRQAAEEDVRFGRVTIEEMLDEIERLQSEIRSLEYRLTPQTPEEMSEYGEKRLW